MAPLHCLSPGPGASANAVGTDAANAAIVRTIKIARFILLMPTSFSSRRIPGAGIYSLAKFDTSAGVAGSGVLTRHNWSDGCDELLPFCQVR